MEAQVFKGIEISVIVLEGYVYKLNVSFDSSFHLFRVTFLSVFILVFQIDDLKNILCRNFYLVEIRNLSGIHPCNKPCENYQEHCR